MKKVLMLFLFLPFFWSCKQKAPAENDLDAARNFLDAALAGKWNDVKVMVVPDSTNLELVDRSQRVYERMKNEEKIAFMQSHPYLHETRKINDSVTIVNYSNSHTNKHDSLRIVRIKNDWLIDLKYSVLAAHSNNHE